jgi:hypothetical protein
MVERSKTLSAEVLAACRAEPTVDVRTARLALGIGEGLAYQLIARDEFPVRVLRAGRKLRVPSAELLAALGLDERVS